MSAPTRVLFVCHANVCRSPMAEAIFRHLACEAGVADAFEIDSAGVMALDGSPPHPHTVEVCAAHGIEASGAARQLMRADMFQPGHVLVADGDNLRRLTAMMGGSAFGPIEGSPSRVRRLREVLPTPRFARAAARDVPDPVGGDLRAFGACFALVHACCEALLRELAPPNRAS